jgi:hypothetical protein
MVKSLNTGVAVKADHIPGASLRQYHAEIRSYDISAKE